MVSSREDDNPLLAFLRIINYKDELENEFVCIVIRGQAIFVCPISGEMLLFFAIQSGHSFFPSLAAAVSKK